MHPLVLLIINILSAWLVNSKIKLYYYLILLDTRKHNIITLKGIEIIIDNIILFIAIYFKDLNYSNLVPYLLLFFFLDLNFNCYLFKYLFLLIFLFFTFICLIFISNSYIHNNYLNKYKPVKYILYLLLLIIILYLIYFFLGLNYEICLIFYNKFNYIWVKIKHLSQLIKSIWNIINSNSDMSPKNPKNSDISFNIPNSKNKKIHKDIKKKATELQQKVLNNQKIKLENNNYQFDYIEKLSLSQKRNLNYNINIEQRMNLSYNDQLKKIQEEYKAYINQDKKFKKTLEDINKGRENFYPNESKLLFKEYLDLLRELKVNLKDMEKNMKKLIKKNKK